MNKKGFTLVELLAVIAILAILVIIALPNVLKMYNDSKKNAFMTEAQTLAKEVSSKYISESMKGNKVSVISNKQNPLDMTGRELEYSFELDSQGKIINMWVSNGTYCISTNKDYTKITRNDISDKCSAKDINKIAGTLTKSFYEESGRTDRSLVSSIIFYSDGRTVSGAESYDVSEKKDGSIKMYVSQNSENTSLLDLTIVANGKIAFPEDSFELLAFYTGGRCSPPISNISFIEFNHSIDTSKVTNMSWMFEYSKATTLDLSSFDTSNVTDMVGMFNNSDATEIKGLNKFNTSKVTNMRDMFAWSKATALDLSSFNTSKVTNMSEMFYGSDATVLDLSSFDTSNVTNMRAMFEDSKATEIKGLNKFNTSKVTSMNFMFDDSKVTTLDLSSFDTSKVTSMNFMFYNSKATTGYARTQADADKFNNSPYKPSSLTFTVK